MSLSLKEDKYIFVRCNTCQKDNKVTVDEKKSGHFQCGYCKEYLMFYGTNQQKKSKFWIWTIAVCVPIGYLGYSHKADDFGWTERQSLIIQTACEQEYSQKRISANEIRVSCECLALTLKKYHYNEVKNNLHLHLEKAKRSCDAGKPIQYFE